MENIHVKQDFIFFSFYMIVSIICFWEATDRQCGGGVFQSSVLLMPGTRKSVAAEFVLDEQLTCLRVTSSLLQKPFDMLLLIFFVLFF